MTGQHSIIEQAARWHVASAHHDMDWDAFTAWLEADPNHRARYDEIARADAMMIRNSERLTHAWAIPTQPPPTRRLARWMAGAAAVAATLALAVTLRSPAPPSGTHYTTGASPRTIALADGSRVVLAPRSRLDVADDAGHAMRLAGGAYFDIRHDPARAMTITAGPVELRDIGTTFDVQADGDTVRVAVASGTVSIGSAQLEQSIPLSGGHALVMDGAKGQAHVTPLDEQGVGAWRQGQLSYDNTPLALVVQDLERYAGVHVDVPANLRERTFSGVLRLRDGQATARDLARLMGLDLVRGPGDRLALHQR